MNDNLKARKLKTKGILLYFGNDEEAIEVGEYIDNLQSKIDKAIEYIEKNILNEKIEKVDWDFDECYFSDMPAERIKPLIDILKEDK